MSSATNQSVTLPCIDGDGIRVAPSALGGSVDQTVDLPPNRRHSGALRQNPSVILTLMDEHNAASPVDSDTITVWDAAMSSTGRVEVGLSPLKVVKTFGVIIIFLLVTGLMAAGVFDVVGVVLGILLFLMVTFLGLMPHLQFVTGGKPAVLVDSAGIQIARWGRLVIPWSAVEKVEVYQSTRKQANAIIQVTPTFYAHDLATRPSLYRLLDAPARLRGMNSYSIPSTTTANTHTLAAWLDHESQRRRGQV